jgi:hypothetical protein
MCRLLAYVGEKRNAYIFLVRKREGKRHLGRFRRKWEDNIKINFKEVVRVWTGFISSRWRTLMNIIVNISLTQ